MYREIIILEEGKYLVPSYPVYTQIYMSVMGIFIYNSKSEKKRKMPDNAWSNRYLNHTWYGVIVAELLLLVLKSLYDALHISWRGMMIEHLMSMELCSIFCNLVALKVVSYNYLMVKILEYWVRCFLTLASVHVETITGNSRQDRIRRFLDSSICCKQVRKLMREIA